MSNAHNTFCPLPWVSLAVRNNGSFRVCCHSNVSLLSGVIKDNDNNLIKANTAEITAVRNSQLHKDIRKSMLQGAWHPNCIRCKNEEAVGLRSRRLYSQQQIDNKFLLENAQASTQIDGSINTELTPIYDLDLRFGNLCNLRCRMCGPMDSSAWLPEYKKYEPQKTLNLDGMDWYQNENFWQQVEPNLKNIKHIYIAGGEPMLIDRHFLFLQKLVDKNHSSNITLEYNTNMTKYPANALEIWSQFKLVMFGVSIDGFGPVNDYIRYPSQFNKIFENVGKLLEMKSARVWISSTVSIYSVLSIIDLAIESVRFFRLSGVTTIPDLIFKSHALHKPDYMSLQALPTQSKLFVTEKLQTQLADAKKNIDQELYDYLEILTTKYINFMNKADKSATLEDFFITTSQIDESRNQKFSDVAPELYRQILNDYGAISQLAP